MQEIRRKFEEFDKDGSGTISADELGKSYILVPRVNFT